VQEIPAPGWTTGLGGYAQLCGATGIPVTSRDQLDEAMSALFASEGAALLCVEQDAELL
jgi:thiamine pyrophosphate-dependent acetolactate synthase large subunit-like protein